VAFNVESILASLASLTIGTLIGTEFSRYFYRPKVIVRYKEIDPNFDDSGVYWSLQIENMGRTVALDCVATITLFDITKENILKNEKISIDENLPKYQNENIDLSVPREQIVTDKHFRHLRRTSLCWAKIGNPDVVNINPGISQSVDLCKFQKTKFGGYFIFPSEAGWRRVRTRISKNNIKGYVLICPSNEFPTRVNIELLITENKESQLIVKNPSFINRVINKKYK